MFVLLPAPHTWRLRRDLSDEDQRPPTSSQPPAPLQVPGLRSPLHLPSPSASPSAFPTSPTCLCPSGPLSPRSPSAGCLFSWLEEQVGQLVGGQSRGYNPFFLLLQLDTTGLGDGEGNGISLLHELGEFNPSRSSLALLNSKSSLSQPPPMEQRGNHSPKTIPHPPNPNTSCLQGAHIAAKPELLAAAWISFLSLQQHNLFDKSGIK